jgi:endonuclease YncB( thermonuclease family)
VSELVYGKVVTLLTQGLDKYGRTLADVFLLDGTHVNHILVKEGWCWWYRKYAPLDTVLEGQSDALLRIMSVYTNSEWLFSEVS